jgi:hypothetical protein
MRTIFIPLVLLGAALTSWGGASITSKLGLAGWRQADVALFAFGMLCWAIAPTFVLGSRIRELEAKLQMLKDRLTIEK